MSSTSRPAATWQIRDDRPGLEIELGVAQPTVLGLAVDGKGERGPVVVRFGLSAQPVHQ